jgi:cell fate regulator YaaT (PSP1 superfamily)
MLSGDIIIDMDPFIVGIRFQCVGKIYHFDASNCRDLKPGDHVIVETSRGKQLGQVAQLVENPGQPPEGKWKQVERLATPRDLLLRQSWRNKEPDVLQACRNRAAELKLQGIKIITVEYSYDGSRLSIYFGSEAEEKVDLKSLRQDMQKLYPHTQLEMRQIGPRDIAKLMNGMGACGLEKRCCGRFLTEFSSISIKMAKEQGISLTPAEITGMCGRLRCCLIYEYEQYAAARALLPKRGKHVRTPDGDGKILDVYPLRGGLLVEIGEAGAREYHKDDVHVLEDYETPKEKPQVDRKRGQPNHAPSPAHKGNKNK